HEARWARLEGTRGFRLLNSFWKAAARGRGRDEAVIAGCVTENTPAMLGETLRLVQSTRWFGGDLARARFIVCAVEAIDPEARRELEGYGAEVRVVQRFDPRNPTANKLRFLEEATRTARDSDLILLLDCDMVVVRDPLPFLQRGALAAKIADVPSVPHEAFERLFEHFGLPLLPRTYLTTLLGAPTMAYFNTAVVAFPGDLARAIVPVWVDYNRRIVDVRDRLMGSCAHHSHQASLTLALASHPIPVAEAPVEINFPLHLTHIEPPQRFLDADPAILHYHKLVDAEGYLLPSVYPRAQARIEEFNRRLRQERAGAGKRGPVSGRVPV
ncbi:MAG TPA: hypothetical protein VEL74_20315, partial [Thermoanaerobaculia bacterium]|nr:hypothetical protein [Thermoanaerobaculia bacterium]